MPISMYQISVPVYIRMLTNLAAILEKAAAHCAAKKIDPAVLTHYRLYPDMYPFHKQVWIAADHAKNSAARLAGIEVSAYPDVETTFPDLVERVKKTIAYLETFKPGQIDGSETRDVVVKRGDTATTYRGQDYLLNRALPNFYFHLTTAYAILRHNGVELGKKDFLGG